LESIGPDWCLNTAVRVRTKRGRSNSNSRINGACFI
jgi:hypothetical protein